MRVMRLPTSCAVVAALAVIDTAWQPTRPLLVEEPVVIPLAPRDHQRLVIDVDRDTFVFVHAEGGGALWRLRVIDSCGEPALDDSRVGGDTTPSTFAHVSTCAGRYELHLTSLEQDEPPRRLRVRLAAQRAATAQDRAVAAVHADLRAALDLTDAQARRARLLAAVDRARSAGDAATVEDAVLALARLDADAGRTKDALAGFAAVAASAASRSETGREADARLRLGRLLGATGQPVEGERTLETALSLYEQIGHVAGQAEALYEIGGVVSIRSQHERALDLFARAVSLARAAGDRRSEAAALNMRGVLQGTVGDADAALTSYQQALAIRERIGDRAGTGQTLSNLGVIHRSLGDSRAAIARYEEALTVRRADGSTQGVANTLHNLAVAWADLGEHDAALELYQESLAIWRTTGGRRGEAFSLTNIGQSYAKLGNADEAERYFTLSLPIWREQGDRRGEALAYLSLGGVHLGRREYARAHAALDQALRLAREHGYKREVGQALASLANVELLRGSYATALTLATEAVELTHGLGDRREEGRARSVLGAAQRRSGDRAAAIATLQSAVSLLQAVEDRQQEATAHVSLADAFAEDGDVAAATTEGLRALDLIESLRSDVSSEGLRISFFASKRPLYERAIELLLTRAARDGQPSHAREAFRVSERSRARALLDLLVEGQVRIEERTDGAVLREWRQLQDLISTKTARLVRLLSAPTPGAQAVAARRELEALIAKDEALRAESRARHPAFAELLAPEPASIERLQAGVLEPGQLLLEYWMGERQSTLWIVSPGGSRTIALPARAEIERVARQLTGVFDATPAGRASAPRPLAPDRAGTAVAFDRDAAALSQYVLAPAAHELSSARTIFVVADGALQSVPFAALPAPGAAAAPLSERSDVVMLPSASVLVALSDRARRRASPSNRILVVGDPVFSADDARVPQAANVAGAAPVWTTDFGGAPFARLRFSAEEAARIAALAPTRTTLALGFDATPRALGATVGAFGVVHVAAHALFNDRVPHASGIVLSLVDREGRAQNGFIALRDIYAMPLAARLVVLSACATALGTETPGEGLVGLSRGLLFAGADRVMASLWAVDDRATAALMGRFYEGLLREGRTPAAALREAQRWMRRDPRWRHPYYWAPWVVIGG